MNELLRPFQKQFLKGALAPDIDQAALSIPRGNGKSWLSGYILARCMTPGDPLHQPGKEYALLASSLTQARIIFRFVRAMVPGSADKKIYRWTDSTQRIGCLHIPSLTRLNVISSKATGAFGLVDTPIVVAEEAGTWETVGGSLMASALDTSLGKPGSPMKVLYIGTLAPSRDGWWVDLVNGGSQGTKYIQTLQGRMDRWDQWSEIRRCNPLVAISEPFRKKLLSERDDARQDARLRAQFCSYRLNLPTQDEATTLLTIDDYQLMIGRPTPPREGQPIVGEALQSTGRYLRTVPKEAAI